MSVINFIKTYLQDYKVAAALPSSHFAIKKIISKLKPGSRFVVEYGGGDGVITKEILKKLPADGKLIVIELNQDFIKELKKIKDDRLTVLHDDVLLVSQKTKNFGLPQIDAVISGIPFSLIKKEDRKKIVSNTLKALQKNGLFILYQYSPAMIPILKYYFKEKVKWSLEPRNILPYFIMIAEKI